MRSEKKISGMWQWGLMLILMIFVAFISVETEAATSLDFNNGNYVQIADSPSLDITGEITMEAWIYKTWNGEDWNIIFSKPWDWDGNPWHVYRLGITNVGDVPKNALCSFALSGGIASVGSTSIIPDNTWVHLACSYDGSTMNMYVNGILEGSVPATGTILTNDQPLIIGRNLLNTWNDWFGRIDEVRVWSIARTSEQIQGNMNRSLTGTETGLAGYWKFDEGSATTASDTSVNGNTGTLIGSPSWVAGAAVCVPPPSNMVSWWGGDNNSLDLIGDNNGTLINGATYATGKVGQAFSFDGAGDYVTASTNNLPLGNYPRTITAWINAGAGNTWGGIFHYGQGDCNGKMFGLGKQSGRLTFWGGCADFVSDLVIPENQWTFVAVIYNGSQITLWMNDQSQTSNHSLNTQNSNLWIGGETVDNGSSFRSYYQGLIDEVGIYTRALTDEEITAIYNAGSAGKCRSCVEPPSDMIAWWKGEDNADDTIGANDGTLIGDTTYETGKVGQAFSFDGVDDYVDLPDGFADFTSGFTVGLWANATPSGKWARFIDLGNGRANNNILFARRTTSNDLAFEVYDGAGNSTGMAYAVNAISNNEWHYYAATLNAAGQVQLYKDGLPLVMAASTTGVPANVTRVNNYIGKSNWEIDLDAYYAGSMDEVVIFNRALSAEEIAAIYNAGSAGKCVPETPQYALTITKNGTGTGTVTRSPEGTSCGNEPENVALNKTVTALTNTVTGAPEDVVNGSFSDVWYSYQGGYSEVSFVVDLENEVTIDSLRFQFAQTENYAIYSSNDGVAWTTRHSGSWNYLDATYPMTIDVNGAYSARYIKYLGTNNANAYVGVLEFEVYVLDDCAYHDEDTAVTLTATPDSGSAFSGWSGACSGTDACEVTMDADKSVAATFTRIIYSENLPFIGQFDGYTTDEVWTPYIESPGFTKMKEKGTRIALTMKKLDFEDCNHTAFTTIDVFAGENLVFEVGAKPKGTGLFTISVREAGEGTTDDMRLRMELTPEAAFDLMKFETDTSEFTTLPLDGLAYSFKNKQGYKAFKLVKRGLQFEAYINEMLEGEMTGPAGLGASGMYVELLNSVCSEHSGKFKNVIDYVYVAQIQYSGTESEDVVVLAPNGGETLYAGGFSLIEWAAPETAVWFTIEYSKDNGVKWKMLDTGIQGTNYVWNLREMKPSESYLLRITGYDAVSNMVGSDVSDGAFEVVE